MKKKDRQNMHDLKEAELRKQIKEGEQMLASGLVNRYTKPSKNTREGKTLRNKIAVLKTIVREKEMSEAK